MVVRGALHLTSGLPIIRAVLFPAADTPTPSSSPGELIRQRDIKPGALAKAFRDFWQTFLAHVPNILLAIVVLAVMIMLARAIRRGVETALQRTSTEAHVHLVIAKLAYFATILTGLMVGLAVLGFNLALLVGSLGLASVALGFALQDILGNFVAGIVLLLEHPFTRGDYIITEDTQGVVEDIRVRATQLRTADGQLVLVPNKLLFTNVLTNASATNRRRIQVVVTVPYHEDTARTRALLLETVGSVEEVMEEPPPALYTQDFGQGGIQLVLWFWVDPRSADMLHVRSEVLDHVERALREADIDLVAPTLMATVPSDEAERRNTSGTVTADTSRPDEQPEPEPEPRPDDPPQERGEEEATSARSSHPSQPVPRSRKEPR